LGKKQRQSFEEFDVLVVQPEKERGNYEYGEKNENKNSPPGEHYVTTHGTPIDGMADTLTTIGTVSLPSVLHYHGYITNPVVCAKNKSGENASRRRVRNETYGLVTISLKSVSSGSSVTVSG
jgi:hypothetical protein